MLMDNPIIFETHHLWIVTNGITLIVYLLPYCVSYIKSMLIFLHLKLATTWVIYIRITTCMKIQDNIVRFIMYSNMGILLTYYCLPTIPSIASPSNIIRTKLHICSNIMRLHVMVISLMDGDFSNERGFAKAHWNKLFLIGSVESKQVQCTTHKRCSRVLSSYCPKSHNQLYN